MGHALDDQVQQAEEGGEHELHHRAALVRADDEDSDRESGTEAVDDTEPADSVGVSSVALASSTGAGP